jgi:uncharacterized protein YndB with AHSA1/START domain
MKLPHSLTRSLLIRAPRDLVFRYFTDSARFARWWGEGSTIEGRVGGQVKICYPNQVVARGEVTELEPGRRIVFTYGYENSHPELPPGSSRVTIRLTDEPEATRHEFRHDQPEEKLRDHHVPGWRYHLPVFANVVADERHHAAADVIDAWFRAWAETDAAARADLLHTCTTDDVSMQDRFSCLHGREELHGHIGNTHVHLPGINMSRTGEPRHCQGTLLVDWAAADAQGAPRGKGTNVVRLHPDGRIASVVGFW